MAKIKVVIKVEMYWMMLKQQQLWTNTTTNNWVEYDRIMQERREWEEAIARDPNQIEVPYVGMVYDWDLYETDLDKKIDDDICAVHF